MGRRDVLVPSFSFSFLLSVFVQDIRRLAAIAPLFCAPRDYLKAIETQVEKFRSTNFPSSPSPLPSTSFNRLVTAQSLVTRSSQHSQTVTKRLHDLLRPPRSFVDQVRFPLPFILEEPLLAH
jgi:hypothetical protein